MFTNQTPREFTKVNIESLNIGQNGVYVIFRKEFWIYVGKGDIRQRLLAHINGDNPDILRQGPTHWVGEIWNDPDMSLREKELIVKLQPICNKKVG